MPEPSYNFPRHLPLVDCHSSKPVSYWGEQPVCSGGGEARDMMRVSQINTSIAIIDDDQSVARMLSRVIVAEGFDVQWFRSAEEFLATGSADDYACLILDVNLPGMSGVELQQRLNDSDFETPIVFISGQADETVRHRLLTAGAACFLSKPFRLDSLLECLHQSAIGWNQRTIFKR
jgi:FixJ family two-component response regulator